jgi:hypothetical protein
MDAQRAQPVAADRGRNPRKRRWRRGVVAILAMMFLVLFGSLGLAMAVASKGNLRTAETHIHVLRATSAAETGLEIAVKRLENAAARFVVSKSEMTPAFVQRLWDGTTTGADGRIERADPVGYTEAGLPTGIAQALVNTYAADTNTLVFGGSVGTPAIASAPATADTAVYRSTGWVVTPITAIDGNVTDASARPAAYQVTYAPLAGSNGVRVVVTGYSAVNASGGGVAMTGQGLETPVTRIVARDVTLRKQHRHAVVSPVRVLIGKNVNIDGTVGATFDDVTKPKGDPVNMKSDFYGLAARLDSKLNDFFAGVVANDVDGDGRLRTAHSVENAGLPPAARDYDSDGTPDNAFADFTGDGFVDDYDIFLTHFDANKDGKVVLSAALTAGTANSALTAEFTVDDDLARMIDGCVQDRNRNGVSGWQDANRNGLWDAAENLNDYDAVTGTFPDRVLGWRDGALDRRDPYAKVRGQMSYRTGRSAWETARGSSYQNAVQGAIRRSGSSAPVRFEATTQEVPNIDVDEVRNATLPLAILADGASFNTQVATQLGVSVGDLAGYTEADTVATNARYFRADMSNAAARALTGQDLYEKAPFNSPNFTDWYVRPRYENMTFKNVVIPAGLNALFVNCTFVGVTHVRSETENTHTNWSLYGRMVWDSATAKPVISSQALDKSDFARYYTGAIADGPTNYTDFPDPPVIGGVVRTGAARNTKLYSNNIRFHNCMFVGSVVSDTPRVFNPVRNKLQFTGSTQFYREHPTQPTQTALNPDAADVAEIAKSSMMLPQYSVELGQFNSPTDTFAGGPAPQNVQLRGTIVAGVLDARGNTDIEGSLIMTFRPVLGQAPLEYNGVDVGNPANFNLSLGYFGPTDGDEESLDPSTLPTNGAGVRIVGYDTDGDGLADVKHDQAKPAGSTDVPFYGYGRVTVRWNPTLPMPDGIMLPLSAVTVSGSYREGKAW